MLEAIDDADSIGIIAQVELVKLVDEPFVAGDQFSDHLALARCCLGP